jgi:HSP20 family molecular chaperone IbpA
LGEYVEVKAATMENGILTIFLERELPEEKKPKIITIR